MFVLAHLSDPHLPMPRPTFRELASKRVIGFMNWQRGRKRGHRLEVLQAILDDMAQQKPDHIAVTGDLVNIALPDELEPALKFLARVGAPEDVTFVPGNHDAYVRRAMERSYKSWGAYMHGDGGVTDHRFPFVRRRGPLAIVGISTAIPTAPFLATGKVGADQLRQLGPLLAELGAEGLFRVVLLHHPPVPMPGDRFKKLVDAREFNAVIAEYGAELILHGHMHVSSLKWIAGAGGEVPVAGVPSASAADIERHERASYNLYRIGGVAGAWVCEMISRGYALGDDQFKERGRRMLEPARAQS